LRLIRKEILEQPDNMCERFLMSAHASWIKRGKKHYGTEIERVR
jgi:hypothetical protein